MDENWLEERLSRPSPADLAEMRLLEGDILILGAGGKMGPSLVRRAQRAARESGTRRRIVAVSRFSDAKLASSLEDSGVETLACDLLEPGCLDALPEAPNVVYMAARKFGTSGREWETWALNSYLPGRVAERFRDSRIVAFSTGNVYPLVPVSSGGAAESTTPQPVGEYAQSALGRERIFEYFSRLHGTRVVLLRLNYAVDLRYGVLVDIATRVLGRRPVSLHMGHVNVIWQGDANSICLRALARAASPPLVLNVTGPETLSVRSLAVEFGARLGIAPIFEGEPPESALLSDASRCRELFGPPEVGIGTMIDWVARWLLSGGALWDKPTHFEVRDGRF